MTTSLTLSDVTHIVSLDRAPDRSEGMILLSTATSPFLVIHKEDLFALGAGLERIIRNILEDKDHKRFMINLVVFPVGADGKYALIETKLDICAYVEYEIFAAAVKDLLKVYHAGRHTFDELLIASPLFEGYRRADPTFFLQQGLPQHKVHDAEFRLVYGDVINLKFHNQRIMLEDAVVSLKGLMRLFLENLKRTLKVVQDIQDIQDITSQSRPVDVPVTNTGGQPFNLNVAIDLTAMSNCQILPPRHVYERDGRQISLNFFHLSAVHMAQGLDGKVVSNVDLIISDKPIDQWRGYDNCSMIDMYLEEYGRDRFVERRRQTKPVLHATMRSLAQHYGFKHFHPILSYEAGSSPFMPSKGTLWPNVALPPTEDGTFLIKPRFGARSIGMYLVESHFLGRFIEKIVRANDKELSSDNLKFLETKLEEFSIPLAGQEKEDQEGIRALVDQGACIETIVPNVTEEYRLITAVLNDSNLRVGDVVKRARRSATDNDKWKDLQTIDTTGNSDDKRVSFDVMMEGRDPAIREEIRQFLSSLPALYSVDLFFTKEGKWGVFEYCSQFGFINHDHNHIRRLHLEYVEAQVNERIFQDQS